jgi:hypothetical protein
MRATGVRSLVTGHWSLLFVLACAGCAQYGVTETNYFTIEHAFTDTAAARAQKDAGDTCARKKLIAVKTSGACTLTRCTTHFQCMSKEDAGKYKQ